MGKANHRLRVASVAVERGRRCEEDRIRVTADNGLSGFGEGVWCESALRARPDLILGRSPFEAEAIYDDLVIVSGVTPGGLDIALWDLAGKALAISTARLLGKTWRTEVRVAGPVDLTPLPEDDPDAWRRLKEDGAVPLVAAGRCGMDALLRLVQGSLVDIIIPEVARYGLTGLRRLAYYCWLFRVRAAVACSGSELATAAALTAAAGYVRTTSAIAAPEPFLVMPGGEGMNDVPGGAGLGIEVELAADVVLEVRS